MSDARPTWGELIEQTRPQAQKLAKRIERQLEGNPQGACILALCLVLADALASIPDANDRSVVFAFLDAQLAAITHPPHYDA